MTSPLCSGFLPRDRRPPAMANVEEEKRRRETPPLRHRPVATITLAMFAQEGAIEKTQRPAC